MVAQGMGGESEAQVSALLDAGGLARPEQRLPLLEMVFPALKRRPPDYLARVLATVNSMIDADGRVDVFEYLLASSIKQHMWESENSQSVKMAGKKSLGSCQAQALQLMAILASHGGESDLEVKQAFKAGLDSLGLASDTPMPQADHWDKALDLALPRLDQLKATEKEKLVRALTEIVLHDNSLSPSELELLRVSCDLIHVPLPLLAQSG